MASPASEPGDSDAIGVSLGRGHRASPIAAAPPAGRGRAGGHSGTHSPSKSVGGQRFGHSVSVECAGRVAAFAVDISAFAVDLRLVLSSLFPLPASFFSWTILLVPCQPAHSLSPSELLYLLLLQLTQSTPARVWLDSVVASVSPRLRPSAEPVSSLVSVLV